MNIFSLHMSVKLHSHITLLFERRLVDMPWNSLPILINTISMLLTQPDCDTVYRVLGFRDRCLQIT